MKKSIITGLVLALLVCLLPGCCIKHAYINANCETPIICENCGKTQGKPLGHDWQDASCLTPKICRRCGLTEGKTLDHKWMAAICIAPKTCILCSETEGEPLGHNYRNWVEVDEETMERFCPVCTHKETAPMDRQSLLQGYLTQTRWIALFEAPLEDIGQKTFLDERADVLFGNGMDVAVRAEGKDFPGTWKVTSFGRFTDDDEYKGVYLLEDGVRVEFTLFKDTSGQKPDYLFWVADEWAICFLQYTTGQAGTWIIEGDSETVERMGKLPGDFLHIWENGTVVFSEGGVIRTGIMYDLAGNEYYGVEGMEFDCYFEVEMEDGEVLLLMMTVSGDVVLCDSDENIMYFAPSPVGYEPSPSRILE